MWVSIFISHNFILLIFLSCCSSETFESGSTPQVQTVNGALQGEIILTPANEKVYAFYGIPFAKPPINELRFKKPVPAANWDGILDATRFPNACSQIPGTMFNFPGEDMWNPNTPISEDCLYLNIWVPESVFKNKAKESAKVMFWIYGGGYFSGTSTLDVYNGAILAGEQDVVVVSTQYRLGPLGFLYFGNDDAPGSVGLLDQNLALRWTHENIQAFGGDSESITLFGESCGGASVTYHLLSPLSRPFFKNAIVMSGYATAPWAFKTNIEAADVSMRLAKAVGCWAPEKSTQSITSCLQKIDHVKLSTVQSDLATKFLDLVFVPTVDGHFLTDEPNNLIMDDKANRVDIITGNVRDEGGYFLVYPFTSYYKLFNPFESSSIPYETFVSIMNDIFGERSVAERDAILNYYTNWENPEDGHLNQNIIMEAIGDAYFTCPGRDFADKWAARGLNVYYYYFTERTASNSWGEWMGVLHGDEIEYAFGIPLGDTQKYDQPERKLSVRIMELFANFARTGVPSQSWSTYTKDKPVYLNLNSTIISDKTPSNLFGPRPDACAFWNTYLPKLARVVQKSSDRLSKTNADAEPANEGACSS